MKKLTFILILYLYIGLLYAQSLSEWRGPNRTGVYNETGLLKEWPESGPEMLWFNDSLPAGFSSIAIANQTIYVTGITGKQDMLVALDMNGKELWRKPYGKAWEGSYTESRVTPTVENDRIYLSSGKGEIVALDAHNGNIIWTVDAFSLYNGVFGRWGLAESILLDEKYAFLTTGGETTTMLAFNKQNGTLAWKSESIKDNPSYTSPLMIEKGGKRLIINVTDNFIIGVYPESGKIAWKFDFGKHKKERQNNTNTPLYFNGEIYVTDGYDHAGVKLKLEEDLNNVSLQWVDTCLDSHHGGAVKVGGYIYGSNWKHNSMGNWVCLDWKTGKPQYEEKWKNKGSIIAAGEMLYIYEEQTGYVGLVKADPKEFNVISSFKVPKGSGPHWAHPVINRGILYIRHGNSLMAFDIKEK